MCGFRVGDEIVAVDDGGHTLGCPLPHLMVGSVYVATEVTDPYECLDCGSCAGVRIADIPLNLYEQNGSWEYAACSFRKVERKSDSLSIEAFLTIKPGFEEPKRTNAPAKKERV